MTYSNQRVTILGLGLFSGGVNTARFFVAQNAKVTVTDLRDVGILQPSLDALQDLPIRFVLGEHREQDILEADLVVISPAIQPSNTYLKLAQSHGIPVTTEINLVFERCRATIIGVTGSNGKTTTTSLIGAILGAFDSRTLMGGNIGQSLLHKIDGVPVDAKVILELSSFQLNRLQWIDRSPHISVVTNVSPNHLDWHGTFEDYVTSKQQIVMSQTREDIAILNADDQALREWADSCHGRHYWFSTHETVDQGTYLRGSEIIFRTPEQERTICDIEDIKIPGPHNLSNVMAAITTACVCDVPTPIIQAAVNAFQGVAHRLEFVLERDGIGYYNDSACTTPDSTITALQAFDRPIILIAGGYDKGIDFGLMGKEIVHRAKAVVLIGTTADAIETAIRSQQTDDQPVIERCKTLDEAIAQGQRLAETGDVIVLSPGCASYDMFTNFEERGNCFKKTVVSAQ